MGLRYEKFTLTLNATAGAPLTAKSFTIQPPSGRLVAAFLKAPALVGTGTTVKVELHDADEAANIFLPDTVIGNVTESTTGVWRPTTNSTGALYYILPACASGIHALLTCSAEQNAEAIFYLWLVVEN